MSRRRAAVPLACVLLVLVPAARAAAGDRVPRRQTVARILVAHDVHPLPRSASSVTGVVRPTRPLTGVRTVLPVLGRTTDTHGRSWLHVRLPGRTRGERTSPAAGWIRPAGTVLSAVRWRLVVDLRARRLLAYRDGRRRRSFVAIVGKPSTPTPRGAFFVEENVRLAPARVGFPFALATSARSAVLQEFAGGPGQVAIHGLGNVGGKPGTAASHGCIRIGTRAITWLAARIAPGTPFDVR